MDADQQSPQPSGAPTAFHAGSCSRVGAHPWADADGFISPREAGTWIANMILTAGGTPSTAFECARLVAEDIERQPEKFGVNPAKDADPINPNRPAPIRNGGAFLCPKCGKRHQVGFCLAAPSTP